MAAQHIGTFAFERLAQLLPMTRLLFPPAPLKLGSTLPSSWTFHTPYLFYLDLTNASLR